MESEGTFDRVNNLVEVSLERCCDVFVHKESLRIGCDIVLTNRLDNSYVCAICSQSSSSPKYCFEVSIENPMFCDCNVDLGREDSILVGSVGMLILACP